MEEKQVTLNEVLGGNTSKPKYVDGENIKIYATGVKAIFRGILPVTSKNGNDFKVLVFETHIATNTYVPTWCISQDSSFPLQINKEYVLKHVVDKLLRVENV